MKGLVNENILDALNLRPLDEVLKEKGIDVEQPAPETPSDDTMQQAVSRLRDLSAKIALLEGSDHSDAMDDLHTEILTHARDLMSYGFNIDHPRARGIFEIASLMYGHAINAKNSKRDAQLKSMKLAIDRKRLDLEEKRTNHAIGQANTTVDNDGTILVEDRNELLRQMRAKQE